MYQPPKLAAVPFEDDDSKEARKLRRNAKEQLKMANTEIMRDLRSEYTDTPEEISHNDIGNAGAETIPTDPLPVTPKRPSLSAPVCVPRRRESLGLAIYLHELRLCRDGTACSISQNSRPRLPSGSD